MTSDGKHTVSAFDEELAALRAMILDLGDRAAGAARDAVDTLQARDSDAARAVADADKEIDALAAKAETLAVDIIARRAPMADDLRVVVSAIKISALLERTADYAKNIARRVPSISAKYPKPLRALITQMAAEARSMLIDVVRAYATSDVGLADRVRTRDDKVDELHEALTKGLIELMIEKPDKIGQAAHLLFVSKHLERIGDMATNIAEMVTYMVTGAQPETRDTGPDLLAA